MDILNTIISPITTEKTAEMQKHLQYAFKVSRKATKTDIKKMFEMMYQVKVEKVQVMVVPSKTRAVKGGRIHTKRPTHKKAIVTLKKSEKAVDLNKLKLNSSK